MGGDEQASPSVLTMRWEHWELDCDVGGAEVRTSSGFRIRHQEFQAKFLTIHCNNPIQIGHNHFHAASLAYSMHKDCFMCSESSPPKS